LGTSRVACFSRKPWNRSRCGGSDRGRGGEKIEPLVAFHFTKGVLKGGGNRRSVNNWVVFAMIQVEGGGEVTYKCERCESPLQKEEGGDAEHKLGDLDRNGKRRLRGEGQEMS